MLLKCKESIDLFQFIVALYDEMSQSSVPQSYKAFFFQILEAEIALIIRFCPFGHLV